MVKVARAVSMLLAASLGCNLPGARGPQGETIIVYTDADPVFSPPEFLDVANAAVMGKLVGPAVPCPGAAACSEGGVETVGFVADETLIGTATIRELVLPQGFFEQLVWFAGTPSPEIVLVAEIVAPDEAAVCGVTSNAERAWVTYNTNPDYRTTMGALFVRDRAQGRLSSEWSVRTFALRSAMRSPLPAVDFFQPLESKAIQEIQASAARVPIRVDSHPNAAVELGSLQFYGPQGTYPSCFE